MGNFKESRTLEIRSSLTLEDTPSGIPGAELPNPEDLVPKVIEHRISPGDTLAIEVFELRQPQVPFQTQAAVSATGYINLPVVGRVDAVGITPLELENEIINILKERNILIDPEVTVNPLFLQEATYSIFGIGVSAANNAPLRAGTFPIRRPGLQLLEAINQVGGLNEFVVDIYVFRYESKDDRQARRQPIPEKPSSKQEVAAVAPGDVTAGTIDEPSDIAEGELSPEEELMAVVIAPGRKPRRGTPFETSGRPDAGTRSEQTEPYLWINDEFVPNPSYAASAEASQAARLVSTEPVVPTVDWDRVAGDVSYRIIRIPADLLRGGNPEANIVVRSGDVIRIVSGQIGVYYVMGQVNRVGPFTFNTEAVTLKAAIAAAGGLGALAWPSRCTVYRRLGRREQMIQVDLDRIFAGKDADFLIKRGDIINVGTHPFAPFLQRIRGLTLPNPVATAGYSFTYARNFADIDSFSVRTNPRNQPDRFPGLFP